MKLTIEIPDAHTGDLLQFIAGLTARTVEANPDPAPGHPELPLESLAAVQCGKTQSLQAWAESQAAAYPLKVAMEDPVEPQRLTDLVRPEVGKTYRTRNGSVIKMHSRDDVSIVGHIDGIPTERMHYTPEGHTVVDDGITADPWDLVEELPF